jgi:hypothetical protein
MSSASDDPVAVGDPQRGTRKPRRRAAALGALMMVALIGILAPSAAHAQDDRRDPEQILAERYAPVVMVKSQDGPCDRNGEPFEPAPADIVLDNPEVLLRQVGNGDPVTVLGPSASDLFDLREGWYLDFPGDALEPGCIFEQDFHRFFDGTSVVYAHVATQADRPGLLALQYWMFWYHNPAKNNHEGDWEFIQLLFEADTVDEALDAPPVAVGYAQHTGGERSSWVDSKFERIGERPVVYAARGSHASYFGSALYLGRSSREGFGCDNTSGPSRRLDPEVVLLPDEVTDRDDPLAWLSFQGRWGQREAGFFNGPTGPFAKERWAEPVTWQDGLRSSSVVIPGGDRIGDDVIRNFCRSVEIGSSVLTISLGSPWVLLLALALVGVVLAAAVRGSTWSPVTTSPLRSQRAVGQILRASWRIWLRQPRAMLTVGLVFIPVAIVTSIVQAGILAIPFVDQVLELAGNRSGLAFLLSLLVGGIADLLTFVYVVAAVARFVDRDAGATDSGRVLLRRDELRELFGSVARAGLIIVVLMLSVIGIPWAIRQLVRYQFAPQAVALENIPADRALARSSSLVTGQWWWTAAVVLGIEAAVAVVGFGAAVIVLLTVRALPLWAFNIVGALIYVVLVPIGAAALTYAYGTLAARRDRTDS